MTGSVLDARGLVPFGHLCWGFGDRGEFLARAQEYLADGLECGQWVEYVGAGGERALREELSQLDGASGALAEGAAGVCPIGEFYRFRPGGRIVDPVASVEARVAAAEDALARGFSGFRAIVDCTTVARTPEQREAFARFEHLIDRVMSLNPVTALCAYDRAVVGSDGVSAMACLHPLAGDGETAFHLYAEDGHLAVAGEIDLANHDQFGAALRRVLSVTDDPQVEIDAGSLGFIDHRGLIELDRHAEAAGVAVTLVTPSETVEQLATILSGQISAVRVAVGSEAPG